MKRAFLGLCIFICVILLISAFAGVAKHPVATSPEFGSDFSNFRPNFSDYKAIVWNYDARDWPKICARN